jgi:amylosucrase
MIFYGDEVGYTNDYSYLDEADKSYDNRWMHRPKINWQKNNLKDVSGTTEQRIFSGTKKLLSIRKSMPAISDKSNLIWMTPHNVHVAGFIRFNEEQKIFCLYNFSNQPAYLTWYAFKENGFDIRELKDHWTGENYKVGNDNEYLVIAPYEFHLMESV